MTDRGFAALRFAHPDLDTGVASGLGTDPAGRVALATADDAVRQSLLILLSTSPGERVMRPEYGCPLNRLMFQPLDNTTAGLAIHYVEQAVRRWEPRAEVLRVDAYPTPDRSGSLSIELHYRVRSTRAEHQLSVDVSIEGDGLR